MQRTPKNRVEKSDEAAESDFDLDRPMYAESDVPEGVHSTGCLYHQHIEYIQLCALQVAIQSKDILRRLQVVTDEVNYLSQDLNVVLQEKSKNVAEQNYLMTVRSELKILKEDFKKFYTSLQKLCDTLHALELRSDDKS